MALAWVLAIIGWAVVFKLPDQYVSTARVYIDSDSLLKPLLKGITVESADFRQQLGAMTSQLLSRPNLEKLMRMTDLDINVKNDAQKEEIIDDLEKNITLSAVQTQRNELPNIYEISNKNTNAKTAKNVVQSLLNIFLETAIGQNREDTGVVQVFLEDQIKEYEARLESAENRLVEFKRKNMGVLPSQGVGIFQRLQTATNELSQIDLELLEATHKRDEISRQIQILTTTGQSSIPSTIPHQLSPEEQRISTLQQKLDELQIKYTQDHPAVRETKQTLDALLKQQAQNRKKANSEDNLSSSNPIYQQLKISLSDVNAQIAGMTVRKNAYQERLKQLHNDVATLPEVEAELQRLDRDYEVNKQQYNELVKRRESAKLAEHVGESGENVKFRVIDPPRTPVTPVGPNRPMYSSAVLLLAIGVGLGLAFIFSQFRPVFHDRREVQEFIQLPVFGVVSRVWTQDLLVKRKVQFAAFILIGVVLVFFYGGVVYMNLKGINPIPV